MSETGRTTPQRSSEQGKGLLRLDPHVRTLLLATLVGVVGGLGAVAFRLMIQFVHFMLVQLPRELVKNWLGEGASPLVTVLAPAVGGAIVGSLVYFLAREAKGHGVPEIVEAVNLHSGKMRARVPFVKIVASAVTIGSNGSAGREGPIAQSAAALPVSLHRDFDCQRMNPRTLSLLASQPGLQPLSTRH